MSIEDELRKIAENASIQAHHRAATLEQKTLELEEEVARTRAASRLARNSGERLANFPVTERGDFVCPICWVERGQRSILRAVPNRNRMQDTLVCTHCGPFQIQL